MFWAERLRAVAVECADGERGAVPADEFFEVELHAEAGVVGVGEGLAPAADGIARDVVCV